MKKLISLTLAVLISAFSLCACSDNIPGENLSAKIKADENITYNFDKTESSPPASYTAYKTAAMNFSIKILNSLRDKTYSPAALFYQLSLLQNAASADTQNKIKLLTNENLSLDELNECNGYFFSRLENLSDFEKGSYIDINGDMFFNEKTPASQSFLLSNADFYNQGIFRLDFSDNSFTEKINSYISAKTESRAGYSEAPDKGSDILLLNSAFMSDSWLNGYDKNSAFTYTFKGKAESKKTFFKSTEYFLEDKNCTGFIKDFKNTPAKLVALLPKEDNIDKFLDKLNADRYFSLMSSMKATKTCEAYIPEFSAKNTLSLKSDGELSFLFKKGNYSELSYDAKAKADDIIQSFSYKITSNGINTSKTLSHKTTKKQSAKKVILNRPFLYMIVDNESLLPIYIGVTDKL